MQKSRDSNFDSHCSTRDLEARKRRRLELISSAVENVGNRAKYRCGPYIISDEDLHSDLDISENNTL